jgi:hypothetical protein
MLWGQRPQARRKSRGGKASERLRLGKTLLEGQGLRASAATALGAALKKPVTQGVGLATPAGQNGPAEQPLQEMGGCERTCRTLLASESTSEGPSRGGGQNLWAVFIL